MKISFINNILLKDILIDLKNDYFDLSFIDDNFIFRYSIFFNILSYKKLFKNNNLNINKLSDNYNETLAYLINLSHKYNNTQNILLLTYSYIIYYYLYKEDIYNIVNIKNNLFLTPNLLVLNYIDYAFLDEFIRNKLSYPDIINYHKKAANNFYLYFKYINKNKLLNKYIKLNFNNKKIQIFDDNYLRIKNLILEDIKYLNKKLF